MFLDYKRDGKPSSPLSIPPFVPQALLGVGGLVVIFHLSIWLQRIGVEVPAEVLLDRLCQLAVDLAPW